MLARDFLNGFHINVGDKLGTNDSAKTKGHPSNGISPGRLAAYQILKRVEEEGAYASILLATWDELPERDRALCYELTMGSFCGDS